MVNLSGGGQAGFDYELLVRFAKLHDLTVETVVPEPDEDEAVLPGEDAAETPAADAAALAQAPVAEQADAVTTRLESFRFRAALSELMKLARASNGYLDAKQPWKQRKQDLAACGTTINVCLQTVRALATLMAPFLPFSAEKCAEMLALDPSLPWDRAAEELVGWPDRGGDSDRGRERVEGDDGE